MNRCADTNKVRYRTELDALIVLSERAAKDKGEVRAYRCPACKGWHLTSMKRGQA